MGYTTWDVSVGVVHLAGIMWLNRIGSLFNPEPNS